MGRASEFVLLDLPKGSLLIFTSLSSGKKKIMPDCVKDRVSDASSRQPSDILSSLTTTRNLDGLSADRSLQRYASTW
jgi:hypothetical protein